MRDKRKLRPEPNALDYPWVVARDESGHLSDSRETHRASSLLKRTCVSEHATDFGE